MLTSRSPASPPPPPSTPPDTYSLNTKALLYVLKHTSGNFTPPTEPPQTLQFSSLLPYTSRDERDKPSTALHYTQLWNQFDIDPGKLRCFPVFGQWLSFAFLLGMLAMSRRRGKKAGGRAGGHAVLLGSLLPVLAAARLPAPTINVSPHRSCPASTLFTISLLGATVCTCIRADAAAETAAEDDCGTKGWKFEET